MNERILIPLDGSETAEAILPQVRRFLQRHAAEVVLLQVRSSLAPDFHFAVPGRSEEVTAYLRKRTFELIQDGIPARAVVRQGPPAEEILDVARKEQASMIAIATHGRRGFSRFALGSVAESVLRSSPLPVLLVRSLPHAPISRGRLEALPFHSIVVPLDGSEASARILPAVVAFARPLDATVTLLHVSEADPEAPHWDPSEKMLNHAGKVLTESCVPVHHALRKGDPADEILRFVEEQAPDLIFMATHGRGGPPRWVMGSVTEKVLRRAPIPLIVAKSSVPAPEDVAPRRESSALLPPI